MNTIAQPRSKALQTLLSVLQILGGSLLLGLFAQIKIPLGFTPVPLTGQTFGVMFVTLLLGCRKGPLAVLAYLAEGSLGLPVFAGGAAGIAHLIGPTGGYFIGFLVQSILIGQLLERTRLHLFWVLLATSFVQMGLGAFWLGLFTGLEKALVMGFYPFILGDLLKVSAVSAYFSYAKRKAS